MRLLALSDIHNNVSVVRRLRAQEGNDYDAVIVAGDLGSGGAREIMEILSTFECPVLFVLGNWDHELPYNIDFGPRCVHLHHRVVYLGGYAFTGFSGVEENWGQNLVALRLEAEAAERHKDVIAEAERLDVVQQGAIEQVEAVHQKALSGLNKRTADRRRKEYRDKVYHLDGKRWTALRKAEKPLADLKAGAAWQAYEEDRYASYAGVLAPNRAALARIVRETGPSYCIVVTHKRLARTADDLEGVPLFLFGHNHGFADTKFRGSRFVNPSALDDKQMIFYEGIDADSLNARSRERLGNFARIDLPAYGIINVEKHQLAQAGNNSAVAATQPRSG